VTVALLARAGSLYLGMRALPGGVPAPNGAPVLQCSSQRACISIYREGDSHGPVDSHPIGLGWAANRRSA
jgi:hypothetical protein